MNRLFLLRVFLFAWASLVSTSAWVLRAEESLAGFPEGPKLLADGFKFPEGPAFDRKGDLYFSDSNDKKIYRLTGGKAELYLDKLSSPNGLAFDKAGFLYCTASEALLKISPDGKQITRYIEQIGGKALSAPNDLVFDTKGNLFFTNPRGFGGTKPGERLPPSIIRVRPDGSASVVATDAAYPNGIEVSPDGRFLYVCDTLGAQGLFRYPLNAEGDLGKAELLGEFAPGVPDGMAMAASGNIYLALNVAAKVMKLSPDGNPLKEIVLPPKYHVSNFCFGGADMKTLYLTTGGIGSPGRIVSMPADEPGLKPLSHQ